MNEDACKLIRSFLFLSIIGFIQDGRGELNYGKANLYKVFHFTRFANQVF